ncbi:MAG: hypothetical protein CGW95_04595 [Phenylobacterium zucineum]|nr:MAG: hypothetical protein CGW95_04595 [Phenylobacterium zucineum]
MLVLSACALPVADLDADRMGRTTIDAIQRADWPVIDQSLAPAFFSDPEHAIRIEAARAVFPADPPWSIKLISSDKSVQKGRWDRSNLSYLYTFPGKRVVIDLQVEQHGWRRVYDPVRGRPMPVDRLEFEEPPKPRPGERPYKIGKVFRLLSIATMEVTPEDDAQARFFGPRKSVSQWAFFATTLATPIIMISAMLLALRARRLPWRLLWMLAAFVGLGAAWMDWRVGSIRWLTDQVTLFGFGFERGPSPLSPWMVHTTAPIGAIAVFIRLLVVRSKAPSN